MKPDQKPRRGMDTQRSKREWEREIKMDAIAYSRGLKRIGLSESQAANRLGIASSTLGAWEDKWRLNRLAITPRGRPLVESDRNVRDLLLTIFYLAGPGVGVATLRDIFPTMPRSEIEDLLRHFRKQHLFKGGYVIHMLRWQRPGAVWAIDFTMPPTPIDAQYPYLLNVRDLASGNQLLALPTLSMEMCEAVAALEALFIEHGAPLVVKADNGFDADVIHACMARHRVSLLLSPPYYPMYNGSIEAGIGSLKVRAHHEAARHGHPGQWSSDDVESARLQANEFARPWGHDQESPLVRWLYRQHITEAERYSFQYMVARLANEVRAELNLLPACPATEREERIVDRTSVSRALSQHGFLCVRRKRFTPPIKRPLWAKIS